MAQNDLHLLDQSLEEANKWLEEIAQEMRGVDRQVAYHALRGVLFAIRDRIPPDDAHNLAAQLPIIIRGIYFEGYKPAGKPLKFRDSQQFLDYILNELTTTGDEGRVLDAFRAVLTVLDRRLSGNEIGRIRQIMPEEIRNIWPELTQETTTSVRTGVSAEANRTT